VHMGFHNDQRTQMPNDVRQLGNGLWIKKVPTQTCPSTGAHRGPGDMLPYLHVFRLHWQRDYQGGVQVTGLDSIDHVVLVMMENRSFDHMLGFLYPKSGNFDGLDGTESNADADGNQARVFPIAPGMQNAYYFPLANPAEGYKATNDQLF